MTKSLHHVISGRRPTPQELRYAAGRTSTVGGSSRGIEIQTDTPPPEDLLPAAKELWSYVVPRIVATRVLTESDIPALRCMCECYSDLVAARQTIAEQGRYFHDGMVPKMHPAVRDANDSDRRFRTWLVEFGLTPSARTRTSLGDKDNSRGAAEFFDS